MKRTHWLLILMACGCGVNPGTNPEPVQVTGSVVRNGKPVTDVVLNLQATGRGVQATLPIKNGSFQGSVVPGRYTFFISEGANASAFKVIPTKYQQGSLERQFDIDSNSTTLTLTMD